MNEFSQLVKENIKSYVYCLLNPEDNLIFYIWKWVNDRVFQHAKWVIEKDSLTEKEEIIKSILNKGKNVKYFILRHNLTDNEAIFLESTLIDLLTYDKFNFKSWADLKNLAQWFYKSLYWIMPILELEAIYWAEELKQENINHNLMIININKTYKSWESLYEATRKSWVIDKNKINKIEYYITVYKWVTRAIFKFDKCCEVFDIKGRKRIEFEWYEITKSNENPNDPVIDRYLFKKINRRKWEANPIKYLFRDKN